MFSGCFFTTQEVFDKEQLIVVHILGLLMVVLATITLPYLTAGNLIVFTAIRCGPFFRVRPFFFRKCGRDHPLTLHQLCRGSEFAFLYDKLVKQERGIPVSSRKNKNN